MSENAPGTEVLKLVLEGDGLCNGDTVYVASKLLH
jgi:hypothetical protein